jgi:phage FluMu protein Com
MHDECGPQGRAGELRCMCGSLLARLVPGGVELKCRRCHRTQVVPLEGAAPAQSRQGPGPRGERS